MRYEGRLSDRYNHLILKFFNYNLIEEHVSIPDLRLKVCLALEYIKFKTVLSGKKLRIHIHPKVDLDQRLSLYYLKRFMNINDNQIELIKWPELTVLETKPFDIAIDIAVSNRVHHKDILVFDHHNGESKNTIEQLQATIEPDIPMNLIDYVDSGHVEGSNLFEPQNIAFLKDFNEEKIIQIFASNSEFKLINHFEEKDLYRKWRERKRKLFKTLRILEHQNYFESSYGNVVLTIDSIYNASTLALYHMDCEYFINIRSIDWDKTIVLIMRKEGDIIDPRIIEDLRSLSDDIYVYPTKSMLMVGSLYSNHKYIHQPLSMVYDRIIECIGIKSKAFKGVAA